jgi:hypothetical protein
MTSKIFAKAFPTIPIDDNMRAEARKRAEERYFGKKKLGCTEKWEEDGLENLYIGNLGEIAFAIYFNTMPDFHVHFGADTGWDFLLNGWKLNVKASKSFFKGFESFLINKNEIDSKADGFLCVQITQDEKQAYFFGYLPKAKLFKYRAISDKLHYPAFKIAFSALSPMSDILDKKGV